MWAILSLHSPFVLQLLLEHILPRPSYTVERVRDTIGGFRRTQEII